MQKFTDDEKRCFGNMARAAAGLSICETRKGAILVLYGRLASCGHNRPVVSEKRWEISAIYDAIFSARDTNISGGALFCSHFPSVEDMKLIVATGVDSLYFFGLVDDPESVELMNALTEAEEYDFELTQLS